MAIEENKLKDFTRLCNETHSDDGLMRDAEGNSLLHLVIKAGRVDMAKELLESGSTVLRAAAHTTHRRGSWIHDTTAGSQFVDMLEDGPVCFSSSNFMSSYERDHLVGPVVGRVPGCPPGQTDNWKVACVACQSYRSCIRISLCIVLFCIFSRQEIRVGSRVLLRKEFHSWYKGLDLRHDIVATVKQLPEAKPSYLRRNSLLPFADQPSTNCIVTFRVGAQQASQDFGMPMEQLQLVRFHFTGYQSTKVVTRSEKSRHQE